MKKRNAPTAEQIALFDGYVSDYQSLLNLRNWRIEVSDKPAQKNAMADCDISSEDHLATIRIGSDWGRVKITDGVIEETVVHELLHIALRPLIDACKSRDENLIASTEHALITVLEKLIRK